MVYLAVAIVLSQGWLGYIILSLIKTGRDERRELEMKLLAICNPPAAVHVESIEQGPTGSVTYMDDQEMVRRAQATK